MNLKLALGYSSLQFVPRNSWNIIVVICYYLTYIKNKVLIDFFKQVSLNGIRLVEKISYVNKEANKCIDFWFKLLFA